MLKNKKNIIGINTLFMIPNKVGGTEYHLRSTLNSLEKKNIENEYVVFCNKENFATFNFISKKWKKILIPVNAENRILRILFEQIILPFLAFKESCDILHSFGYFGPLITYKQKLIVTVHDTNWKDHPEDMTFFAKILTSFLTENAIKYAKAVITDSDFSENKLRLYLPECSEKLFTITPGIEPKFVEELQKQDKDKNKMFTFNYILCVSAFYPHKNIPYLLSVWKKISKMDKNLHLIIVGSRGKDESAVLDSIKDFNQIHHFKKVSLSNLANLYSNAQAFVFPSKYEGFGFPVYEALAANLSCFVMNRKIYQPTIRNLIIEMTGDSSKDAVLIYNFCNKVKNKKNYNPQISNLFNYDAASEKLLKIYNNI